MTVQSDEIRASGLGIKYEGCRMCGAHEVRNAQLQEKLDTRADELDANATALASAIDTAYLLRRKARAYREQRDLAFAALGLAFVIAIVMGSAR